ncbi:MAG: hypothetical protein ACD_82C00039G0001, partial [uncultured bacterium]
QPFIDAGIDHFLIFDTGSTDRTIEITEELFKKNNIKHAVIKQEPFIDFATSRNRCLELTEDAFPNAEFMIMLDAEWYMHGIPELLNFCEAKKHDTCPSYLVRLIMNETLDFYAPRLIKMSSKSRFYGVVHETLDNTTKSQAPSNSYFEVRTSRFGREKSKTRWYRDKDLLMKEHLKNPTDARTVFYLAQTYDCLEDLENARFWYEKRIETPGWYEENFVALCRLAQVYENLSNKEKINGNLKKSDELLAKSLLYYSKAYSNRPIRVEPLIKLAQYYLFSGEKELCYLYAKRACEIPYPETDILFVEKNLYDFTRWDLLGISAWYVGEYAIGKAAIIKAMEACPNMPHLQQNLACYNNIII